MRVAALPLVGLACALATGCVVGPWDARTSKSAQALTDAEAVRDIVLGLPPWLLSAPGWHPSAEPFDQADLDAYMLAAIQIMGYSSSDARDGIELAMNDASTLVRESARANAFVLLRVLFDVPETISQTNLHNGSPYAIWVYHPSTGYYPLRWPVAVDSQNVVTGIANFMAIQGGEYDVLDDYDWFSTTYGHRDLPACVGRCGNYNASLPCQCDSWCTTYEDCCVDYDYTCGTPFAPDPPRE